MRKIGVKRKLGSEGQLFKQILADTWHLLHPDIQVRFDKNPQFGKPLLYKGEVSKLWCSWWGKFLGYATMPLIKGALIPYRAEHARVDIQVYSKEPLPYIFKKRMYHITGRKPLKFTSYMREGEAGHVLEYVGCGFGMKLKMRVKDGNLHFESKGYFWDIGICRIPLPDILSPGKTRLVHENRGPKEFFIRIEITHRLLGRMFVQEGVFQDVTED